MTLITKITKNLLEKKLFTTFATNLNVNFMSSNNVYMRIPSQDLAFMTMLAGKMGWDISTNEDVMQEFLETRPTDADITEDEIMQEVRAVRYC